MILSLVTVGRRTLFKIVAVGISLLVPLLMVAGYVAYRSLTSSIVYCGSYGEVDEELGRIDYGIYV